MKEICKTCGKQELKENMELHHILPRSLGGTDLETNLILICVECHGKIHGDVGFFKKRGGGFNHTNPLDLKQLQRAGIERAKAEGKYKGRQKTARKHRKRVIDMASSGIHKSVIAKTLGIGQASVYRILQDERNGIKYDFENEKNDTQDQTFSNDLFEDNI